MGAFGEEGSGATNDEGAVAPSGVEVGQPWREDPLPEAATFVRDDTGFQFGSYGRVTAGSDLRGGAGGRRNVVSHGPRLEETPYFELDFAYRVRADSGAVFTTWTTVALTDALLHYDGNFDAAVTLRNAYVEAGEFGLAGLSVWAGSRMWRGDDIYLLDFWPLDEMNTVGAGLTQELPAGMRLRLHAGVNRLDDPTNYQEIQRPHRTRAGTEQELVLDRQRVLTSARIEQLFLNLGDWGAKWLVYGETHHTGGGELIDREEVRRRLPSDIGWMVGAQFGGWHTESGSFVNLFLRYAGGLAVFGELGMPQTWNPELASRDARQLRFGISANAELGMMGVMLGGYVQQVEAPWRTSFNPDDYTEAVVAIRPVYYITEHLHAGAEVSWQTRAPRGLSGDGGVWERPEMWKFALLPALSIGRGTYARPQLRGMYVVSVRNDAARHLYPAGDLRRDGRVTHFLGVGAEWWFNSSTYFR
jgi:maltoporin